MLTAADAQPPHAGGPDVCVGFTDMITRLGLQRGCILCGNSMMGGGGPGGTDENSILPYMVPYTQLRMLVSETRETDFFVAYERGGAACRFEMRGGNVVTGSDARLRVPLPTPLNKFLFFRYARASPGSGTRARTRTGGARVV